MSLWYVWRKPCTYLAPTLTCLQTDRNKISHDPCHLGVRSGASKTFSEPMVCSMQTMHLSCVKISTNSNRTITSFHLSLVTYEYHRVCPIRFLSLWYVRHKPCAYLTLTLTLSQTLRNKIPHDPCHLEVPSRVPKMFSEPMVPSAQTMYLSYVKIRTTSKRTKTSFH